MYLIYSILVTIVPGVCGWLLLQGMVVCLVSGVGVVFWGSRMLGRVGCAGFLLGSSGLCHRQYQHVGLLLW